MALALSFLAGLEKLSPGERERALKIFNRLGELCGEHDLDTAIEMLKAEFPNEPIRFVTKAEAEVLTGEKL